MIGTSGLTLDEGVLLGHALVSCVAHEADARVLIIKGPRQVALSLKPARASVDIDALVHPDDFDRMLAAMCSLGWDRRVPDTSPHVLPFHSVAVAHEGWPCEIDVHHHYPGFFAPDVVVFSALWERRSSDVVAGVPVPVCDLTGDTLIAALHAARAPSQKRGDWEFLVSSVSRRTSAELQDLAALAAATGAADTLRGFLSAVGAPAIGVGSTPPDDLYKWSLLTAGERVRGIGWVHELRQAPLRRKPGVLWRMVFLSEAEVRDQYPQAPAGSKGLLVARLWRLRDTARHLPMAIQALRRRG